MDTFDSFRSTLVQALPLQQHTFKATQRVDVPSIIAALNCPSEISIYIDEIPSGIADVERMYTRRASSSSQVSLSSYIYHAISNRNNKHIPPKRVCIWFICKRSTTKHIPSKPVSKSPGSSSTYLISFRSLK